MIGQGNSVSHGVFLGHHYFVNQADNDFEPEIFRIRGTATPDNYHKSVDEILFSGMLSKGDKSAYHLIISPSTKEPDLTPDEWHLSIDEYLTELGYERQKHVAVKHVKNGRPHMHVLVDRYDYEQSKLLTDSYNFYKHQTASTRIEEILGHDPTPRQVDYKQFDRHKKLITEIWHNTHDGQSFVDMMEGTGYHIGRGANKSHPLRVVPENHEKKKSLDLIRQIIGVKAKEVYERLEGVQLQTEAEALAKVQESKNVAVEQVTEKFFDNLKDENFVQHQEGREKEKKRPSGSETELPSMEHGLNEEELEALLRKRAQEQQRKRLEKLREQQRDQGMSH